jgi:hypothetical protein
MVPANTKRSAQQIHEVLAEKYLCGWDNTMRKASALWMALTINAADLRRQGSHRRARASVDMAARVRVSMDRLSTAKAA